jgi:hypothetical protein
MIPVTSFQGSIALSEVTREQASSQYDLIFSLFAYFVVAHLKFADLR